jgi:hypothetical protein
MRLPLASKVGTNFADMRRSLDLKATDFSLVRDRVCCQQRDIGLGRYLNGHISLPLSGPIRNYYRLTAT